MGRARENENGWIWWKDASKAPWWVWKENGKLKDYQRLITCL